MASKTQISRCPRLSGLSCPWPGPWRSRSGQSTRQAGSQIRRMASAKRRHPQRIALGCALAQEPKRETKPKAQVKACQAEAECEGVHA